MSAKTYLKISLKIHVNIHFFDKEEKISIKKEWLYLYMNVNIDVLA